MGRLRKRWSRRDRAIFWTVGNVMLGASLKRLWHALGSPRWFFSLTTPWVTFFGWSAALLLLWGAIWGLAFAPADYQQGNSFRIMYVHVPATPC